MTTDTGRRDRRYRRAMAPACFLVYCLLGLAPAVCGRAAPAAPASLVATPVSWTQVRLTWADRSADESGFVIERRLAPDGAWAPALVTGPDVTRIEDVGLAAATSYGYRIKAVDTSGGGSPSVLSATVATPAARRRPPIVIMPLGDSITRGTGGTQAGYRDPLYTLLKNAGYSISYVGSETTTATSLLTETNNARHEGHGGYAISQISGGLDGASTGWLTGIPGASDPVYPDVILLMAGTNDIGTGGATGATTLTRMDGLLNKLGALRPAALVVVSTLVPYYGTTVTREQRQADYNASLPALVAGHRAAGRRVWLYDMRTKVNSPAQITADGVHPNQTGYDAIAAGWFEAIQALPLIETWRHARFGSATAAGDAADLADPDSDGRRNLLEYALGGDPRRADGSPFILPQASFVADAGASYLALSFSRRRHADVGYVVETSSDLVSWTAGAVSVGAPLPVDDFFERVTLRDPEPVTAGARRLVRLRVFAP